MQFSIQHVELPARLRTATRMTDEELMRFCAQNEVLRVEQDSNGELILMSPTGYEGGGAETEVAVELTIWARQDGRGRVFGSNTGFRLPDGSVRAADAHWLSWQRANALTPAEKKRYAPVCPEFVIEIRSESDSLKELREKMQMWLVNGAELAWLIDPSRKAVEIYRPGCESGREPEIVEGASIVEGEGPVAGFVLEFGKVWI